MGQKIFIYTLEQLFTTHTNDMEIQINTHTHTHTHTHTRTHTATHPPKRIVPHIYTHTYAHTLSRHSAATTKLKSHPCALRIGFSSRSIVEHCTTLLECVYVCECVYSCVCVYIGVWCVFV